MNKKLIGITGVAKSGKDTAGQFLMVNHGYHPMALADPLKEGMAPIFGISVEIFHDQVGKASVDPNWGITRREMLTRGADALKEAFGQDLFIRRWLFSYFALRNTKKVVVTDVRIDDEARAITELGGTIIRIKRDKAGLSGKLAEHKTEQGVSDDLVDITIDNNGTLQEFYKNLRNVIEYIEG